MSEQALITATHWGNFRVSQDADGQIHIAPAAGEQEPSPIGKSLTSAQDRRSRVARPAIRLGYYRNGRASDTTMRGREPFVEVSWDEALDLAANALAETRAQQGNQAIYGGSYGWASAGRFHHALGQIHRFLQMFGGYTYSVDNYSDAAAGVIIPHVLGTSFGRIATQAPTTEEITGHCKRIVFFGGAAPRSMQVNYGGIGSHDTGQYFQALRAAGVEVINVGPVRDDTSAILQARWVPCRPNSDVAIMLGMIHTLIAEDRYDRRFVEDYCTGFDEFADYVMGRTDGQPKSAAWAATRSEVPADEIAGLARLMAEQRCLIGVAQSLQRARHGEQTFWMIWALAAALGHIGLPGGGVLLASAMGKYHLMQRRYLPFSIGTVPQIPNPVDSYIPVARITEMLERPGSTYRYDGKTLTYPPIDLIYWAGGNPFHHHQDINRFRKAWARPSTVIVNEISWTTTARMADIVFPTTSPLEREDFAGTRVDQWLTPMRQVLPPFAEARDDYTIFLTLAERLGFGPQFSEGRSATQWVEHLWDITRKNAVDTGIHLPEFETFREGEPLDLRPVLQPSSHVLEMFRADPQGHPLGTPSGKIEIFSQTIADFGYQDCVGHPAWFDHDEWLGGALASRFPLHLLSNQPATRLHSQLDYGKTSKDAKVKGREPLRINPSDAAKRGIADGDVVRVFNDRGAFLAGAVHSDALRPGVVQISTGAWYDIMDPGDPKSLEIHGNPNAVTPDVGTSSLAQGPSPYSCLVEIERYDSPVPPLRVITPPEFVDKDAGAHPRL